MRSIISLILIASFLIASLIILTFPEYNDGYEGIPITGDAVFSNEGEVNISIRPITSLVLYNEIINFGSFYVNVTCGECAADTNGNFTDCCVGITNVTEGFSIENQGNTNLSIYVNITQNASSFIGGTNASFKYLVRPDSDPVYGGQRNDTVASCSGLLSPQSWTESNASLNYICGSASEHLLSPLNNQDAIVFHIRVVVPADAIGKKEVGIIFTGTSS